MQLRCLCDEGPLEVHAITPHFQEDIIYDNILMGELLTKISGDSIYLSVATSVGFMIKKGSIVTVPLPTCDTIPLEFVVKKTLKPYYGEFLKSNNIKIKIPGSEYKHISCSKARQRRYCSLYREVVESVLQGRSHPWALGSLKVKFDESPSSKFSFANGLSKAFERDLVNELGDEDQDDEVEKETGRNLSCQAFVHEYRPGYRCPNCRRLIMDEFEDAFENPQMGNSPNLSDDDSISTSSVVQVPRVNSRITPTPAVPPTRNNVATFLSLDTKVNTKLF